ncbi:MAG: TMEM165/GDT1 family protein [Armatimonadota bacterium]
MHAFWVSFITIFLIEIGDKTQLVALCFASRYKAITVLLGIFVATLIVHIISVLLGSGFEKVIQDNWVNYIAGISFIIFALWTLRGDNLDEAECDRHISRSPFLTVTITFFIAELGDKSMLSTVVLATQWSMIPVWIGSTVGMVASDALAIIVGNILGKTLPEKHVKIGAAIIFFGFGAFKAYEGAMHLNPIFWTIAPIAVGISYYIFNRQSNGNSNKIQAKTCKFMDSE